jgi:GTPase SAR1 family protein
MSVGQNNYDPDDFRSLPSVPPPPPDRVPPAGRRPAPGPASYFTPGEKYHAGIAMVGPSQGGKTALLQALHKGRPDPRTHGQWRIVTDIDSELADQLLTRMEMSRFPEGTLKQAYDRWTARGRWPDHWIDRPWYRGGGTDVHAGIEDEFDLQILDLPGGFAADPVSTGMVDYLANADGIILVIDPIRMMEETADEYSPDTGGEPVVSTYAHLNRLLRYLDAGLRGTGRNKLPQTLSVCVSKLDRQEVYFRAKNLGLLEQDDGAVPIVPRGEYARALFTDLCHRSVAANDADIPDMISTYFARVDYHVVSAAGYFVKPGSQFNEREFVNTFHKNDIEYVRRWAPVQVWETLLDLYIMIADRS